MATLTVNTLRLLRLLLARPYGMTKRQLMDKLDIPPTSEGKFDRARQSLENAGILIDINKQHCYAIVPDYQFSELKYLAPLSDEDKLLIKKALNKYSTAQQTALSNKLDSLYDFQQLGLEALRRPHLEKINILTKAIEDKKRVVLERYRSRNSNTERDREVEPIIIDPNSQMLRALNVETLKSVHFKLSRMDRVRLLDKDWVHEAAHKNHPADVFDIVNQYRTNVDLTLNVSAYNDLVERHPAARNHIRPGSQPDTFAFEAGVNQGFIGLTQFILANWHDVEVHGPKKLKDHLAETAMKLHEKFS